MTFKTTQLRDAITFAIAVGATAAAGTGVAFAQEESKDATTLDRIEVTGSRIKRADIETSQPIFSLSREDITAQGLTSVGDVIQNITSNGSTLNSTFNNGGNGETRVNLRNMGSNRTLVLVNGRRWVGGNGLGGAVDLSTIPTAAVERIEVLKDGASTIYGSDAIAGVVNVILRQNFEGAEANAYIGAFDKGDGERQAYDFTIGTASDRWSAMLGIGYVKEEPVRAGDRAISAVPNFGATAGFGASGTTPQGQFSLAGGRRPDGTTGTFIPTPTGANPGAFRPFTPTDAYNFAPDNYLLTPQERRSLFASGTLDITDNLRFKTYITYNERLSEQLLAASPITLGTAAPGTNGANISISAQSIYNPYGQAVTGIQYRPTELGGRSFNQEVNTFVFNGGLEGNFNVGERTWDWEAGYFFGENKRYDTTFGLYNISALRNALGPSFRDAQGVARCGTPTAVIAGCVPLNLLSGGGGFTPEMAAYSGFVAHDTRGYKQKTYYANVGGDLFDLPGGALAYSFGLEHRTESGFDQPDAIVNTGDTTGNARKATSGGYSLDEAYLELAVPVLADVPFAKLLDFSIATRYSDYSNFGDTLNSKFGFRWKPIDDLMIRGNWSEGFRAPSVAELFTGQSDTFQNITDPCNGSLQGVPNGNRPAACAGIPGYNQVNTQIRTTTGGNPNLGAENSTSKTLGFVYSPSWAEGLDISLDWWEVEIENAIFTQTAQAILDNCYRNGTASACALITRAADGQISGLQATPSNIGTIFNEGYDLTVGYRLPESAWGKFRFVWDTTYLVKSTTDVNGDGIVSEDPVTGEGGNLAGEYQGGSARSNNWRIRSNLSAHWEKGDFGASWFVRYYSGQEESCATIAASQWVNLCSDPTRFTNLDGNDPGTAPDGPRARPQNHIGATTYHDASVFFNAPWNARITVGLNNVFDKDPPRSASTFANSFDPQYELPGRFIYFRYSQKF
ncbi:TonB-dependent receptor domain-containing protein [Lysobacter silvisoli]|uniref:TonB-dependent receptor n=1 Tax=Lysobacter silvisoli TaxID=2293254 RepID=A0A371K6G8_9GAMM|nr:TonB-dependent receptor [Lysobacter silvisoli]RDZ29452.1 TonB-dependent receptor [Lysobacter silvisoli]